MTSQGRSPAPALWQTGWVYYSIIAVIIIIYLFVATGYPIRAIPYAGADDGLFFRALVSISQGEWLGAYDKMTLAKGPFLSVLGATSASFGIEAKTLEAILYAAMAVSFTMLLKRLGLSSYLVPALILLLLCSPHVWSEPGRRYLREIVYVSSAMMTLALLVTLFFLQRTRSGVMCALGVGLFSGMLYLTREEDIWMQSCVIIVVGLAAVREVLRNGFGSLLSHWRRILIRSAYVLAGIAVVVGPVLILNHSYYGRAIVSEFRAPEFKAAVGALMRVGDIHASGVVPVPQAAMQAVMDRVPAAASLRPYWPQVSKAWSKPGRHMLADYPAEVAGGWFVWAFRDATARAGYYRSAQDARMFYAQLAVEVNDACGSGALACRSQRDTLRPELPLSRLPELVAASWRAFVYTVTLSSGPIKAPRSDGDRAALERWEDLIGPVVAKSVAQETELRGWIANRTAEPMIAIPNGSSIRVSDLRVYTGGDVVSHFNANGEGQIHAARFRMTFSCPDVRCTVAAVSQNGDVSIISLAGAAPGALSLGDRFIGYLNSVQQLSLPGLTPRPLEALRETILTFVTTGVQIIVPIMVITATLGLMFYLLTWKGQTQRDWLAVLAFGAAAAVIARCVIIAYIDISSWRAIDTTYLGPGYPFVIAYAIVGTQLLLKDVVLLPAAVKNLFGTRPNTRRS